MLVSLVYKNTGKMARKVRVCCDDDVVWSRAARRRYTDMREFAVAADATVIGGLKPRFAIFRKLFSSEEPPSDGAAGRMRYP